VTIYRKSRDTATEYHRPSDADGTVIHWPFGSDAPQAIVFVCPCGGREVYVTSPPHLISFDAEGALTLDGSVGSRRVGPSPDFRRVHGRNLSDLPANWCHFLVENGVATMCDDAACPGGAK